MPDETNPSSAALSASSNNGDENAVGGAAIVEQFAAPAPDPAATSASSTTQPKSASPAQPQRSIRPVQTADHIGNSETSVAAPQSTAAGESKQVSSSPPAGGPVGFLPAAVAARGTAILRPATSTPAVTSAPPPPPPTLTFNS